jgi:hypothetical protein
MNPTYKTAELERGARLTVDALDDLAATTRRVGRPLVATVAGLCGLALVALGLNAALLATWLAQHGACADQPAQPAQLVPGGLYVAAPSSCMSDVQLQAVSAFPVNLRATNGALLSLRPASTLRVPSNATACGALLVRSLDPDYDALLVGAEASLLTKVQSASLVQIVLMAAPSAG